MATDTKHAEETRARIGQAYQNCGMPVWSACEFTLVKCFMDFKAWDAIPDEGSISVDDLTAKVGGRKEMVERITNFFIAGQVLAQPAPGQLAHTERSKTFKADQPTAWLYLHMFDNVFRPLAQMPKFFAKHGLASPDTPNFTPLGLAHGEENKAVYEIIAADAQVHKGYNEALREIGEMYSLEGTYSFDWMKGSIEGDRTAIVDIGGSHGYAMRDAMVTNPWISPEKLVLFDLPEVIANTESHLPENMKPITRVGGSMFEPLPEKLQGAACYQYRRVLNDFPDEAVVRTLKNVRKYVAPDTRLLIIEEMLSPDLSPMNVVLDIVFLVIAGKRRSVAMYEDLAAQAGFKLKSETKSISSQFDDFTVLEFTAV